MRHSAVKKLFSAAADGELSGRKSRLFEEHLEGCRECREEFALFEMTRGLLDEGEDEGMSGDFTERLIGRIREDREGYERVSESDFGRHIRLIAGAAALLLLFWWGDRIIEIEGGTTSVQFHGGEVRSWTP